MNVVDNLNSVQVINKPCVCTRTMRLSTFSALRRDREQCVLEWEPPVPWDSLFSFKQYVYTVHNQWKQLKMIRLGGERTNSQILFVSWRERRTNQVEQYGTKTSHHLYKNIFFIQLRKENVIKNDHSDNFGTAF